MKDFDPNKVLAEFASTNLSKIIGKVTGPLKRSKDQLSAKYFASYSDYLERVMGDHAHSRSFFVRHEPQPIYEFFEPPRLAGENEILDAPSAADLFAHARCSVLTGTGGSGKSMLMKHLIVSAIASTDRVPIFFQLRDLDSTASIIESLRNSLELDGVPNDEGYFDAAMRTGHFSIFLDGFDEIRFSTRKRLSSEIQALARKYEQTTFVVTSRPDSILAGWNQFGILEVAPLTLESACSLVEKAPYDPETKEKFSKSLRSGLFRQHSSFLSNPLLLSIMLLTYRETANIPNKLSVFYQHAYEALFQKHDAMKGGAYVRERHMSLDVQDFSRTFSAFSMLTYDKRQFSFSQQEALKFLDDSKRLTSLEYDSAGVLSDSLQAVCLIVEEGLELSFTHRSFQEFFAAKFIQAAGDHEKEMLISRVSENVGRDALLHLLWEIDQTSVEKFFVIKELRNLRERTGIKDRITQTGYYRFLCGIFSEMGPAEAELKSGISLYIHNKRLASKTINLIDFLRRHFPAVNQHDPLNSGSSSSDKTVNQFRHCFPDQERVSLKSIGPRNPFIKYMYEDSRGFSGQLLANMLILEKDLLKRHAKTRRSLDSLLSG